jgi:hypothetical protein
MVPFTLDPTQVRDLSIRLLDAQRRLRVVLKCELEATTPEERLLFDVRHGLYGFPTQELVDFLRTHSLANHLCCCKKPACRGTMSVQLLC